MAAPLDGVRVLEVANWLAAPAATALMADLGAEVVKVEPPGGEVYRGFILRSLGYDYDFPTNYAFETDNRGKRSIGVDVSRPEGAETVRRLAADADVLVTNLIRRRQEAYGLTFEAIREVNPGVVYCSFSGYGGRGPDADRSGFDYTAFWARSGIMGLLGEPGEPPPLCRGGQGDHTTALNILAAVLAALRLRDQTGEAQHAEVTLQASGMWTLAGDYSAALAAKQHPPRISRDRPVNPIWNSYQCSDGRWLLLVNPVPFPEYWPRFCRAVGWDERVADERYDSLQKLMGASAELTAELDTLFAGQDLAYWGERLDREGVIWAPVAELTDVLADPQVEEMGWFAELEHPEHGTYRTLDTPFKLYGSDVGARGPAPSPGAHTFDVLAAAGFAEEELNKLVVDGIIG